MKWIYYTCWFIAWFFILSFFIVPLKPVAATGGVLMVFVYMFLTGLLLVYGFILINKNILANTGGNSSLSLLDKIFIFCVLVLLTLALFRMLLLISDDAKTQTGTSTAQNPFDNIDPQTGERITPVIQTGFFGPSNYWECILDSLPGAQNDIVGTNLIIQCNKKFPNPRLIAEKDKVGGLISVPTKDDCIMKYAKDTTSPLAAKSIYAACYQLYRE